MSPAATTHWKYRKLTAARRTRGRTEDGAPNPIDRHVGQRVRQWRMLLGMSQERLGDALGLTFQQVQKYERGTNRIGASRLFDLSNILDVPVGFFYDDMDEATAGAVKPWWRILKMRFWSLPQAHGEQPLWAIGAGAAASLATAAWLAACPWDGRPESHGSSRWANLFDIRTDGLLAPTGFILGQRPLFDDPTHKSGGLVDWFRIWSIRQFGMRLVRIPQTLSGVLLAPPGTGKTVQLIGLLLADWPDSVRSWWGGRTPPPFPGPSFVVNDPKGEIFRATAAWRATLGPVFRLAWSESDGHRWNPIGWGALPGGSRLPRLWRELMDRTREVYGEDAPDALRRMLSMIHDDWQDRLLKDPTLAVAGNAPAVAFARQSASPDRLRAVFRLVHEQHQLWAAMEQYVDRQMTILIPESVEQHWKVSGRACGAGMTLFLISRCIRDPQAFGEPSYAKVLQWMTTCAKDPGVGFSDLSTRPSGESTDIDGRQRPVQDLAAPANVGEGGDANPDLTAQLLDAAVNEALLHGYPARVVSELREVRMKPDRERGSVISTFAGSVSIFKNAAVASRTSTCSFQMPDIRGMGGRPVTIYVVIPLESAEFLGRVTGLLIESMAAFLLLQNDEEIKTGHQRPVFFLLDEFWTLPAVNAIRQVPSLGRGLWAVVLVVGQSWRQIASRFKGDGENVLSELKSSAPIKIIPTQNDDRTAKETSEAVGNRTVVQTSVSRTLGLGKGVNPWQRNENESVTGLPLIRQDQVMSMEMFDPRNRKWGLQMVQLAGNMNRPLLLRPTVWFLDRTLSRRAALRQRYPDLMAVLYRPGSTAPARKAGKGRKASALMVLALIAATLQRPPAAAAEERGWTPVACPGQVQFKTWQILPQMRPWRRSSDGTLTVGDCMTVPNAAAIPMHRDSSCPILFDTGRAREQSRVVTRDPQGRTVEALPCAPRDGDRSFPVREVTDGCAVEHHWDDGLSIALSRPAAEVDGRVVLGPCRDPDAGRVTLRHHTVACDTLQGQRATYPQARIEIDLAEGRRIILGCHPVGANLRFDGAGCPGSFFHDFASRQSLSGQRLLSASGTPETNCFPDPAAVTLHAEIITGYTFDDARRQAQPIARITLAGTSTVIRPPEPLDRRVPYTLIATRDVATAQRFGCLSLPVVERWGDFRRPDGSTVALYLGPGRAAKGGVCTEGR